MWISPSNIFMKNSLLSANNHTNEFLNTLIRRNLRHPKYILRSLLEDGTQYLSRDPIVLQANKFIYFLLIYCKRFNCSKNATTYHKMFAGICL